MVEEVKRCVDMRVEFFDKYYSVPQNVQGEVDSFIRDVAALGEDCINAAQFEEKFASSGLSDRFNAILPKCTPKPVQMTQEQKQYSKQVAKEIFHEDKDRIMKEALKDAAETVQLKLESDLITQNTRQMAKDGTLDEYTKASNYVEDAVGLAGFFKRKFGKKDNK